jgi:oligoendopeptidase F
MNQINTNAIKNDIEKLKYIIEHSSSKSKKSYYKSILFNLDDILSEILNYEIDLNISDNDLLFMYKHIINQDNKLIKEISDKRYIDLIDKLTKNALNYLKPVKEEYYFNSHLTLNKAKEIIFDFIKSYNESLLPMITKALDDEHLFIVNNKEKSGEGFSVFNTFSSSPYIVIYNDNDNLTLSLEVMTCIVHELGHIIHFYTTSNRPNLYSDVLINNFVEVPSTTFEYLFKHYLIKNKLSNEIELAINNDLSIYKEYLKYLRTNNFIIDKIQLYNDIDIDTIKNMLLSKGINVSDNYIENCFNRIELNYQYSLGGLLAIYYSKLYEKDPEMTKYELDNFIKCIGIMDNIYMLSHFGIDLEHFISCDYLKEEVQRNKKQLEFYKR